MWAKPSALLVDFDNLAARNGAAFVDNIERWTAWLEDGGFDPALRRRRFLEKRVYWNNENEYLRRLFERAKFKVVSCRAVRKEKGSSADFDITIDAAELRHEHRQLQEVVLLSYDADFLSILNHLLVNEIDVWGMADGAEKPAQKFRKIIGTVIEREAFAEGCAYVRPGRTWWGGRKPPQRAAQVQTLPPAQPQKPAATPVVAAPAKATQPAKPAARKPATPPAKKPVADLKGAAEALIRAAEENELADMSKSVVRAALKDFPGYSEVRPWPWLGRGTYPVMIAAIAKQSPLLRIRENANGGKVLVYVGRDTAKG